MSSGFFKVRIWRHDIAYFAFENVIFHIVIKIFKCLMKVPIPVSTGCCYHTCTVAGKVARTFRLAVYIFKSRFFFLRTFLICLISII